MQRISNNADMLTSYKIADYCKEYQPEWTCTMPDGCPPDDVLVPSEHPFFRLANQADAYSEMLKI